MDWHLILALFHRISVNVLKQAYPLSSDAPVGIAEFETPGFRKPRI